MVYRGNVKQRNQLFDIIKSEYSMKNTALNRDPDSCSLKPCRIGETNAYFVNATGASVSSDSSVSLIHRYCAKLPGDRYAYVILDSYSTVVIYNMCLLSIS